MAPPLLSVAMLQLSLLTLLAAWALTAVRFSLSVRDAAPANVTGTVEPDRLAA